LDSINSTHAFLLYRFTTPAFILVLMLPSGFRFIILNSSFLVAMELIEKDCLHTPLNWRQAKK